MSARNLKRALIAEKAKASAIDAASIDGIIKIVDRQIFDDDIP